MGALSADNANLKTRQGLRSIRVAKTSTRVYGASIAMSDTNGVINPNSSATGKFEGFTSIGSGISTTAADRKLELARMGAVLATITSIAATDIGSPVWSVTDNPADLTLTFAAGAKLVGYVLDLEYDSVGAIANKCWVLFDVHTYGQKMRDIERISPQMIGAANSTIRQAFYKVPTGKNAQLFAAGYFTQTAPNFSTSATLNLNKISGATRTNLITGIDVNNTAVPLDTPTAAVIGSTVQTLIAGDILEAELVLVGTLTTAGKLNVFANMIEYAKI